MQPVSKSFPKFVDPPKPAIKSTKWSSIVSPVQESWMRSELRQLGLLPGTPEYNVSSRWESQSLWRTPPPGELQKVNPGCLPKVENFWLHPMFIWAPETTMKSLVCGGAFLVSLKVAWVLQRKKVLVNLELL